MPARPSVAATLALPLLGLCAAARAEHADRDQPIAITAAEARADHRAQTAEFSGDVVVSQGSLEIRAARVVMRPGANGERLGFAWGTADAPVRLRQRGDKPGEWSEGQAERVEYDSLANEVRLIGAASLRNLAGTLVTQSVAGDAITYDIARDRVSSTEADRRALQAPSAAPAKRVTIVYSPPPRPPTSNPTPTP